VNATRPTAWPLLTLEEFVAGPRDAALACYWLLRVIDPADELVSAERCQIFPKSKHPGIGSHRCLKVFTGLMDRTVRESVRHECSHAADMTGQNGGVKPYSVDDQSSTMDRHQTVHHQAD
jgi:hypothetical protein